MAIETRQVLVVDDDENTRRLLEVALGANGYIVRAASNAEEAVSQFRSMAFDAALCDIRMPGADGIELTRVLHGLDPDLPVIFVTGDAGIDTAREAMRVGAYDYITKPFEFQDVVLSVTRAAERRALLAANHAHQEQLEAEVEGRTRGFHEAMRRLERSLRETHQAHLETIFVLSRVAELNDQYTGNHIRRVSAYCEELARSLECGAESIERITYSSPMHDIGKICVPSEILGKPGKLTRDEFEIVKQHTVSGARILEGVPFLDMAREIALAHHERYDGTGYPNGLQGADIPVCGRIVAVADVFDALISRRPYKEPYRFEDALDIISAEAGKHFDPWVLGAFFDRVGRIREIAVQLADQKEGPEDAAAPAPVAPVGPA
jgi:putative two-component system response regulator